MQWVVERTGPVPVLLDGDGNVFRAFGANTQGDPTTVVLPTEFGRNTSGSVLFLVEPGAREALDQFRAGVGRKILIEP